MWKAHGKYKCLTFTHTFFGVEFVPFFHFVASFSFGSWHVHTRQTEKWKEDLQLNFISGHCTCYTMPTNTTYITIWAKATFVLYSSRYFQIVAGAFFTGFFFCNFALNFIIIVDSECGNVHGFFIESWAKYKISRIERKKTLLFTILHNHCLHNIV